MLARHYAYYLLTTFRSLFTRHTPWVLFCVVILGFISNPLVSLLSCFSHPFIDTESQGAEKNIGQSKTFSLLSCFSHPFYWAGFIVAGNGW